MKPVRCFPTIPESKWDFPDPEHARPDGLLASGGDLLPGTLLLTYQNGIFPWTSSPITWWSPDPRAIFEMEQFHVSRRLERVIRQERFQVTFDQAFRQVIEACAKPAPGRESTWISHLFMDSYTELHRLGFAHSIECWNKDRLVGGVYGVAIGGFFAGESMFHFETDASKVALAVLMRQLLKQGFILFDTQVPNPHLESLGVIEIPRPDYLRRLKRAILLDCSFPKRVEW